MHISYFLSTKHANIVNTDRTDLKLSHILKQHNWSLANTLGFLSFAMPWKAFANQWCRGKGKSTHSSSSHPGEELQGFQRLTLCRGLLIIYLLWGGHLHVYEIVSTKCNWYYSFSKKKKYNFDSFLVLDLWQSVLGITLPYNITCKNMSICITIQCRLIWGHWWLSSIQQFNELISYQLYIHVPLQC